MDKEKEIVSLQDYMDRLAKELTEARKHGKDTKIAELILAGVAPKIKYAEISEDNIDIALVKKQLAKIRYELDHAEEK